jgi:hypothetical protein
LTIAQNAAIKARQPESGSYGTQMKDLSGKEIYMQTIRTLSVFLALAIPAALFGRSA